MWRPSSSTSTVAIAKRHRLGQVDQHLAAVGKLDGAPAQVPLVMRQHRPAADVPGDAGRGHGNGARQFGEIGVQGQFHEKSPAMRIQLDQSCAKSGALANRFGRSCRRAAWPAQAKRRDDSAPVRRYGTLAEDSMYHRRIADWNDAYTNGANIPGGDRWPEAWVAPAKAYRDAPIGGGQGPARPFLRRRRAQPLRPVPARRRPEGPRDLHPWRLLDEVRRDLLVASGARAGRAWLCGRDADLHALSRYPHRRHRRRDRRRRSKRSPPWSRVRST